MRLFQKLHLIVNSEIGPSLVSIQYHVLCIIIAKISCHYGGWYPTDSSLLGYKSLQTSASSNSLNFNPQLNQFYYLPVIKFK